jgi:hypothetical protein
VAARYSTTVLLSRKELERSDRPRIHYEGERADKPSCRSTAADTGEPLKASCSVIKKAPLQADRNKKGLFHKANGGTIFLMKSGIAVSCRSSCRVLQENEIRLVEIQMMQVTVGDCRNGEESEEEVKRAYSVTLLLPECPGHRTTAATG